MIKPVCPILIALCLFLGFVGFTQETNLIKNGEFNGEPSFINWYSDRGITSKNLGGNPGGYAWLNHDGLENSDPDINQEIKGLKIGTPYLISGDYKGGDKAPILYNHPGDTVLAIDINHKEIASFPLPKPVSKWTIFKATFVATDTVHLLSFRGEINGTNGDVAIDNISLVALKETKE